MKRPVSGRGAVWRGGLVMALALAAALVAGCSTTGGGSSGIDYRLGLQGATNDHPAPAPRVAASGPDREYAFVYSNQVWVRTQGGAAPRQVTNLTLSAGANLVWGPLVWSGNGDLLAFTLVENDTPATPTSTSGPIYYVDLSRCLASTSSACATYRTPMTGSIYGHTYAWFNDDLLIAGNGSGVGAYDLSDANGPRVWQLRTTNTEGQDSDCPQPSAYGDVQVVGTTLYYSCMTLSGLGGTGAVGSAYLNSLSLQPFVYASSFSDPEQREVYLANYQNNDSYYGTQLASLGTVYSDPRGVAVAGAWSVGPSNSLVFEQIGNVDTKAGTADRAICVTQTWNGSCDNQTLSAVGAQPLSIHAQISMGPGGAVAYQGAKLYATGLSAALATTSNFAPQWVSGGTLLVTSVRSTSTDASGVTRQVTDVQSASGSALAVLIQGASDIALQ